MSWCCPSRPCVAFLACVHLALFIALSLSPCNSLVSSWCDHSMLASLLWRLRTHSFVFFAVHETCRIFLSPFISEASRRASSFFLRVQISQPYVATQWRRQRGKGGKQSFPPYGWASKNYVICAFIVMELLRVTRQIHCKAVEQRGTLIHRQYNRDWGTSYSRPPIDPSYRPHFPPLLQNPGGATVATGHTSAFISCIFVEIGMLMNGYYALISISAKQSHIT